MEIVDPSFDYEQRGLQYSSQRRTDPRIAAYIQDALGSAKTVLNVGSGTGSYEPEDKFVISVEPSATMRRLRQAMNRSPALIAKADHLPFDDNSFDASMALLTVHHWPDIAKGLKEMQRVSKGAVIVMTFDPDSLNTFWNSNYFPQLIEVEKARYPNVSTLKQLLGGKCEIIPVPIPLDCVDGFQEAYYGRPEEFLKPEVRKAQSAWGFLPRGLEEEYVQAFSTELKSGEWDRKYGHFRNEPFFSGALRLIILKNRN